MELISQYPVVQNGSDPKQEYRNQRKKIIRKITQYLLRDNRSNEKDVLYQKVLYFIQSNNTKKVNQIYSS